MTSLLPIYPKTVWNPIMGKSGCKNYIVKLFEIEDFDIIKNPYYIGEVLGMPPIIEKVKMMNYNNAIKKGMEIFNCSESVLKGGPFLDLDTKGIYGFIKLEPRFKTSINMDIKNYLIIQL